MPFNLTEQDLQNAFEALEHHGYSGLVPLPEWQTVRDNWDAIKTRIASFDLDEYRPNNPMVMFAPKTRATLRPVCLLHPIDLLVYSALTLIVKDDLESERIPLKQRRVFSYVNAGEKIHRRAGVKMHHGRRHSAATLNSAFQFDQ